MEKRQNGFLNFLKRNVALVLILASTVAIVTLVVVENSNINQKPPIVDPGDDNTDGGDDNTDGGDDNTDGGDDQTGADPLVFVAPMKDFTISKEYSGDELVYSMTLREWSTHKAVDLKSADNQVFAVAAGTVTSVTTTIADGTKIVIDHGEGLVSEYSSLAETVDVKQGDKVEGGDKIGTASDSNYNEFKDGAHLHLVMTRDGAVINPHDLIKLK